MKKGCLLLVFSLLLVFENTSGREYVPKNSMDSKAINDNILNYKVNTVVGIVTKKGNRYLMFSMLIHQKIYDELKRNDFD